jgi:hypothetical protein
MRFETEAALALQAAFDAGPITSDGGLLWLAQADSELGLCERMADALFELYLAQREKGGAAPKKVLLDLH